MIELAMIARPNDTSSSCAHVGELREQAGRIVFVGDEALIPLHEARERVFPRKWAAAQRLAKVLRWVPSVRFCALANTTALMHARDEADLDFFIIVRKNTLWLTRMLLVAIGRLFGKRPRERFAERDAWCFSFLMDESDLSLERFALPGGDPYLEAWVLRLVPLLDDGIGRALWEANAWAWRERLVQAPWIAWKRIPSRKSAVPRFIGFFERIAYRLQRWFGAKNLWKAAEQNTTNVVMNEQVCKTHLDDRRAWYRERYEEILRERGLL